MRSYSLWALLVIPLTYCFLLLLESPNRKMLWVLYAAFAVLLIYTQVFGIFLLAAQWLAVTPGYIKRLGIWKILLTIAAIGILSVPMAIVMLFRDSGQLDWVPPISVAGVWEVFRNIVGTDILGRSDLSAIVALFALYVLAWVVAIAGVFRHGSASPAASGSRMAVKVLAWSLVFPLAAMIAVSFRRPIVYPRYLLMSLPAAVLLAGQGLVVIARLVPRGRPGFFCQLRRDDGARPPRCPQV
jgi:mannosyltransferase